MLHRGFILGVFFAFVGSAYAAAPTTQDTGGVQTFDFPINKGQFIFVGKEMGTNVKNEAEQGTVPIARWHVLSGAATEKWNLRISIATVVGPSGERVLKFGAALQTTRVDGSPVDRIRMSWHDEFAAGDIADLTPVQAVDVSKGTGIDEFQLYNISYAKIGDGTRYVIVAIANSGESFSKAISIPKRYVLFDWSQWTDFP
jgi:hypothetical protein